MKKRIINYSNGLDLSIWMMKMEILIFELLNMFQEAGVDVDRDLSEEVHSENFN